MVDNQEIRECELKLRNKLHERSIFAFKFCYYVFYIMSTNVAQMKNCTNHILKCQINADVSSPYCNNSATHVINYKYQTCERDSVAQMNHASYTECLCITNPITECKADLLNERCTEIFLTILSIDTVIVLLGMMLNIMVCFIYYRRKIIRNKLPNILLVNHALADLFTCMMYILPNTVFHFILTIDKTKKYQNYHDPIEFTAFVSISSSSCIYTLAGFERWLSIVKPIWHHVHIKTKHAWRAAMLSWLISISCSLPSILVDETYAIYYISAQVIMVMFIIAISALFIKTWYTALVEVRRHRQLRSDSNRVLIELHITKIFALMFLLFTMTFIPLATANPDKRTPERRIKILLFALSAVNSPILTLTLKRDFRLCLRQSVGNRGT